MNMSSLVSKLHLKLSTKKARNTVSQSEENDHPPGSPPIRRKSVRQTGGVRMAVERLQNKEVLSQPNRQLSTSSASKHHASAENISEWGATLQKTLHAEVDHTDGFENFAQLEDKRGSVSSMDGSVFSADPASSVSSWDHNRVQRVSETSLESDVFISPEPNPKPKRKPVSETPVKSVSETPVKPVSETPVKQSPHPAKRKSVPQPLPQSKSVTAAEVVVVNTLDWHDIPMQHWTNADAIAWSNTLQVKGLPHRLKDYGVEGVHLASITESNIGSLNLVSPTDEDYFLKALLQVKRRPQSALLALKQASMRRRDLERSSEQIASDLRALQQLQQVQEQRLASSLQELQTEQVSTINLLQEGSPMDHTHNTQSEDRETELDESLYEKPVPEWTVSDVAQWLELKGLESFVKIFRENSVCGQDLADQNLEFLDQLQNFSSEELEALLSAIYTIQNPEPINAKYSDLHKIKNVDQVEKYLVALHVATLEDPCSAQPSPAHSISEIPEDSINKPVNNWLLGSTPSLCHSSSENVNTIGDAAIQRVKPQKPPRPPPTFREYNGDNYDPVDTDTSMKSDVVYSSEQELSAVLSETVHARRLHQSDGIGNRISNALSSSLDNVHPTKPPTIMVPLSVEVNESPEVKLQSQPHSNKTQLSRLSPPANTISTKSAAISPRNKRVTTLPPSSPSYTEKSASGSFGADKMKKGWRKNVDIMPSLLMNVDKPRRHSEQLELSTNSESVVNDKLAIIRFNSAYQHLPLDVPQYMLCLQWPVSGPNLGFAISVIKRGHVMVNRLGRSNSQLMINDRILEVNGQSTSEVTCLTDMHELLSGLPPPHSNVLQLVISRDMPVSRQHNGSYEHGMPREEVMDLKNKLTISDQQWSSLRTLLIQMRDSNMGSNSAPFADSLVINGENGSQISRLMQALLQTNNNQTDVASQGLDDPISLVENLQSASREEVLAVLQEVIQETTHQRAYLDRLLTLVIDQAPWLLDHMENGTRLSIDSGQDGTGSADSSF